MYCHGEKSCHAKKASRGGIYTYIYIYIYFSSIFDLLMSLEIFEKCLHFAHFTNKKSSDTLTGGVLWNVLDELVRFSKKNIFLRVTGKNSRDAFSGNFYSPDAFFWSPTNVPPRASREYIFSHNVTRIISAIFKSHAF